MRVPVALVASALAAAAALIEPAAALALRHRVAVPPAPPARSLSVDLDDNPTYALYPSRRRVRAGVVRVRVYNRGMDDHDLTIVDASGQVHRVFVPAGEDGRLEVDLGRGAITLYCSLFDHAARGMAAQIRAARS